MYIYFIRHGESEGNVAKIHQHPETPLSNTGISQATTVRDRLQRLQYDAIVSSDYERTLHTANLIHANKQIPFIQTPFLREHRLPSEIKGLSVDDAFAKSVREKLIANVHNPDFHFSDEENLFELIKRAQETLDYLRQLPYETVVAVTHGNFLKCLCLSMVFQDLLTPHMVAASFRNLKTTNTGLTVAEYESDAWSLITWNDHAHLAE
jgi:probable phosphoglycerate mutase